MKIPFPVNNQLQLPGSPHIGERSIEIPIVKLLLDHWLGKPVIEVGAVTTSWLPGLYSHPVYDLYDTSGLAINRDAEFIDYQGFNVLSISTIEHLGLPDYGNTLVDTLKPIRTLLKILSKANDFFISIPTGYNPTLDQFIEQNPNLFDITSFSQSSPLNTWRPSQFPESIALYNHPFSYANTVLFLQKPPQSPTVDSGEVLTAQPLSSPTLGSERPINDL